MYESFKESFEWQLRVARLAALVAHIAHAHPRPRECERRISLGEIGADEAARTAED